MAKPDELIVTEPKEVDISKAAYYPQLGSADLDEDTKIFHATIDRVVFQKPTEIISKVLAANGFSLNLENILACIDHFSIGAKVKLHAKSNGDLPSAKYFLPCIQFPFPNKRKIGSTLKQFYQEISKYEEELSRLQKPGTSKGKKKDATQLSKELEKIKDENKALKMKINELATKLSQSRKSAASAEKAMVSQKILPPELRIATVTNISFSDRLVSLKAGRSSFSLPMSNLHALPNTNDPCLLTVRDGVIHDSFFYRGPNTPLNAKIASVLFVDASLCKVRDNERKIWLIKSSSQNESLMFQNLKRGGRVLLHTVDNHVIRLTKIDSDSEMRWVRAAQEKHALHVIHPGSSLGLTDDEGEEPIP